MEMVMEMVMGDGMKRGEWIDVNYRSFTKYIDFGNLIIVQEERFTYRKAIYTSSNT